MALPPLDTNSEKSKGGKDLTAPLNFQPLSEGLGFHPFSDGLPYAPVGKAAPNSPQLRAPHNPAINTANVSGAAAQAAKVSRGSGAIVAGRPAFLTPKSIPIPRASTPAGLGPRISVPVAGSKKPEVHVEAVSVTEQDLLELRSEFGPFYIVKRVMAYLIDSAFNLALCAGALSAALWKQDLSPELLLNPGIVLIASLFLATFNWAITTAQEVAFGTSVGKRIFGLALPGPATAVFLRAFFFVPSVAFAGIGLIWAVFDKRRRCWHDLVVDLQPIELP
jgi:hypothetical protein